MDLSYLQQFGTALALSVLIGLERERSKQKSAGQAFAGLRTFILLGILGFLAFHLIDISEVLFGLVSFSVFAFIGISYFVSAYKNGRIGLTTEIAAVLTFLIGGLCRLEYFVLATSIALVILTVLYFKIPLHKLAAKLKKDELQSAIKFILIAFVVLPLLPDKGYGPYELINPYIIWLMVVFVSGISFVSYIAIKVLGTRKGIGVTGFFAGLISSTALALNFSKQSKENRFIVNPYAFALIVASTAMFLRVLLEVFVLNSLLLAELLKPFLAMATVGAISAAVLWKMGDDERNDSKATKGATDHRLKSPFRLVPALQFGILFALVMIISKLGQIYLGEQGIYLVSSVSGLTDMDAITVSMANLAKDSSISGVTATTAITIAAVTNTLFKGVIFAVLGARKVAARVLVVFGLMVAAGAASLFFI